MAERQNLYDYVAEQIRTKILLRHYSLGVKLPNEYQLAEEYDVCRYTIREAIKRLSATGLVEVHRGRGTFVSGNIPSSYLKNALETMVFENQEIREIFVARMAIEEKITSLAAQNATIEDIRFLEKYIHEMEEALALNNIDIYNELDLKFHTALATIGNNKTLRYIVGILHDMIRQAIIKSAAKRDRHKSLEGHKAILQSIREHNTEKASSAMIEHLEYCFSLIDTQDTVPLPLKEG